MHALYMHTVLLQQLLLMLSSVDYNIVLRATLHYYIGTARLLPPTGLAAALVVVTPRHCYSSMLRFSIRLNRLFKCPIA
jgi:hypothetical protein